MTRYHNHPVRPVFSYGPLYQNDEDDDEEWLLGVTTAEAGRVEIVVDERAMYELWIEVQDVPWPRRREPRDTLVRETVERVNRMDAEGCRDVLDAAKRVTGENQPEGSR
jgi:hypothetical protein